MLFGIPYRSAPISTILNHIRNTLETEEDLNSLVTTDKDRGEVQGKERKSEPQHVTSAKAVRGDNLVRARAPG